MRIIKSCIVAFSMYSKIPMPQFEWKEEDMQYMLCFFPWVGAVIGVCLYLWNRFCAAFQVGRIAYVLFAVAIPILVTGGFHVDGFMDTMDALHSYQPRERKLEILKDSHIGAFAVIMLAACGLIYVGAFSEIYDTKALLIVCIGFALARCLSGIGVVTLPSARGDGMLFEAASHAQGRIVKGTLLVQGVICMAGMLWISWKIGIAVVVAAFVSYYYYEYRSKKEFGGITGDTAGYFVVICETAMVVAAAIAGHVIL